MRLTRRDALHALAATSAVGLAGCGAPRRDRSVSEDSIVETMLAVADVVYPDAVEDAEQFVETWLDGRLSDESRAERIESAVIALDDRSKDWYGGRYRALSESDRDSVLREMGVDTADEDPGGTDAERVRYFVVNELLYGLYTSPAGGRLAGIENPIGYPGGIASYQRGPQ